MNREKVCKNLISRSFLWPDPGNDLFVARVTKMDFALLQIFSESQKVKRSLDMSHEFFILEFKIFSLKILLIFRNYNLLDTFIKKSKNVKLISGKVKLILDFLSWLTGIKRWEHFMDLWMLVKLLFLLFQCFLKVKSNKN